MLLKFYKVNKKICIFLCFLLSLGTIFYVYFKDCNYQKYVNDDDGDYQDAEEQKTIDLEKTTDFNDLSFKLTFFCGCLLSFLFALVPLYFFTYPFREDYLYFSHSLCGKEKKLTVHPFAKSPALKELKEKGQLMSLGIVRFLKDFGKIGDEEKKIADFLQWECYLRLTFFFLVFYVFIEYLFFPLILAVIIYFSCRRLSYIFKIGNHRLSFKKTYFMIIDNYLFTGNFFKCFVTFGSLAYGMVLLIFEFGFQWPRKNFIVQKEEINVNSTNHVRYRFEK